MGNNSESFPFGYIKGNKNLILDALDKFVDIQPDDAKVLILTAPAGLGHEIEAEALREIIGSKYRAEALNISDPNVSGRVFSVMWGIVYRVYEFMQRRGMVPKSPSSLSGQAMSLAMRLMAKAAKGLPELAKEYNAIICVHPVAAMALSRDERTINYIPDILPDDGSIDWFYFVPGVRTWVVNEGVREGLESRLSGRYGKETIIEAVGHPIPVSIIRREKKEHGLFTWLVRSGGAGTNIEEMKQILRDYLSGLYDGVKDDAVRAPDKIMFMVNHHKWMYDELVNVVAQYEGTISDKEYVHDGKPIGKMYKFENNGRAVEIYLATGGNDIERRYNAVTMSLLLYGEADLLLTKPGEPALYVGENYRAKLFDPTNPQEEAMMDAAMRTGYAEKYEDFRSRLAESSSKQTQQS